MAPKSLGSLSAMRDAIKQKTSAKGSSLTGAAASLKKSAAPVDDSDSNTSSSDDSSSGSDSDSDSDGGLEAAKKKLDAKNAAKKVAATKVQPPTATATDLKKTGTKKAASDTSSDDDSSSESESDSDSDAKVKKPTKQAEKPSSTKKASVAQKAASTSSSENESDSDSDSDDESDAGAKVQSITDAVAAKAAHANTALPIRKSPQNKEAEDSSTSDSESESESDAKAVTKANGNSNSTEIGKPEWLNKSDFMLRKASSDNPGKEVSEFLSQSSLDGKQVWYFTAPASLPITVIKDMEIDLAKAQSGGAILNHKGDAYGLDLEPYTTSSQIQLLIPSKGGEKYNTLNRGIDSTVHLRRIAEFGGSSKVSSTATDQYVRQPKPVREQPKGLKPRFTPIGVPTKKPAPFQAAKKDAPDSGSSSGSDSDVEMTDAAALPPSVLATKAGTNGTSKRKQSPDTSSSESDSDSSDSDEEPSPPPKKSKATDKAAKRAKVSPAKELVKPVTNSPAPAIQAENIDVPSSLGKKSKTKSTPIPLPTVGRTLSQDASATPSKTTGSAKSKKDKKSKADSTPKAITQTPVPPPSYGVGK
ncbi:hypothetical protein KJ359_012612 [Pestalotiopsis sp. 9143b]|nr:hypothetical protein KJ359_012612 [Pestalotiopsis sp. 9143b]